MRRPTEPERLLGAYRVLDDVPDRHLLENHADAYEGRDAWGEWADDGFRGNITTNVSRRTVRRNERRWKEHMERRGRHHALATPDDVDAYCAGPLADNEPRVQAEYFGRVAWFYDHMLNSTRHPHVYSPVLMAAAGDGPASVIWEAER